ncbi:A/G-specific adenine glycosylase [Candidatus Odyssella thessalonicensis]|uniref:A/G-specific adenine glycosylase n=1 Tax=Candidatus Odyssella thessalonicensis TaxID=84647 RepID=UPI000225A8FF|nr:A/G-specific adenine glycosylase [Candidatus Odyssella thessalonicensis]
MENNDFVLLHQRLLEWYDCHQRHLPWRARPGQHPNPYHVLLSEIMLQQTTVSTVIDYFNRFTERWPTLKTLAHATEEELYHQWQGLGYYSRARNLHACVKRLVHDCGGQIPQSPEALLQLPGIGPYTAAAIAAIAYDFPIVPVDGNITRVIARIASLQTPLPALKEEVCKVLSPLRPTRAGDFAQALMDLGATICKPKQPRCDLCPLTASCLSYQTNQQHTIPRTTPKPLKPTRYTFAFWCENKDGDVLLARRPKTGVLANLVGLPTSDWVNDPAELPPILPQWRRVPKPVKHTFTHFHLIIDCFIVKDLQISDTFKDHPDNFHCYPIPTLMKKVINACLASRNALPGLFEQLNAG